ncbi:hypothetical protein ACVIKP_003088 [Rhizobium leguminosarum]
MTRQKLVEGRKPAAPGEKAYAFKAALKNPPFPFEASSKP